MSLYPHKPVLLKEVMEYLRPRADGTYVDCTVGSGGHAEAIVRTLGAKGRFVGIDRDAEILRFARERLAGARAEVHLIHGNYGDLRDLLGSLGLERVDGFLYDLGVSSYQLDEPERGFSYWQEGRLDMRMDRDQDITAWELVNELPEDELAWIIRTYGEERWASRIAAFIVRAREKAPINTTGELVEVIKAAIPAGARRKGPHPARRTFQALRIAVNRELDPIEGSLRQAEQLLTVGGRICVISFHSLEDRIVKRTFSDMAGRCECPPGLPECKCGARRRGRVLTRKPVLASVEDVGDNPRARSARLRVFEKGTPVLPREEDE